MEEPEDGILYQYLVDSVQKLDFKCNDSVHQWLMDIRQVTENECLCVLQGKSLIKGPTQQICTSSNKIKEKIEKLQLNQESLFKDIKSFLKLEEKMEWPIFESNANKLSSRIHNLALNCKSILDASVNFCNDSFKEIENNSIKLNLLLSSNKLNLTIDCNSKCYCLSNDYNPVCNVELNEFYFTPCHAGCSVSYNLNQTQLYRNCSCLMPDATLQSGFCENKCQISMILFVVGLISCYAAFNVYNVPLTNVVLKYLFLKLYN